MFIIFSMKGEQTSWTPPPPIPPCVSQATDIKIIDTDDHMHQHIDHWPWQQLSIKENLNARWIVILIHKHSFTWTSECKQYTLIKFSQFIGCFGKNRSWNNYRPNSSDVSTSIVQLSSLNTALVTSEALNRQLEFHHL